MNPRPAHSDFAEIRQSRKVATVALALDMDEGQVRRLVDSGHLEGHGVGKRGLRVYLDSIEAYQARMARASTPAGVVERPGKASPRRGRASSAAHKAAIAELRRDGLLP